MPLENSLVNETIRGFREICKLFRIGGINKDSNHLNIPSFLIERSFVHFEENFITENFSDKISGSNV